VIADGVEHAAALLALLLEQRRGRRPVQHLQLVRRRPRQCAQLLVRRILDRVVKTTGVYPGRALLGAHAHAIGPLHEQPRDARDVTAPFFLDLCPIG
jgi:hypothetical protein